ncbi:MAG: hypothetical protein AAFX80_20000, partial [Cyanobacteria bacterium J06639_18]
TLGSEPRVRLSAAQILMKFGNISVRRLRQGLLALLEHKNEGSWLRSNVARVLEDLGHNSTTVPTDASKSV